MIGYEIVITGIVQGVGFRPFIYNLANELGLNGWVSNKGSDVIICIDATEQQMNNFVTMIDQKAPVLSKIQNISTRLLPLNRFSSFEIRKSEAAQEGVVFISPDVCTCQNCINELKDPKDKRYQYPFINCTDCGPRFSIIKGVPYDRHNTTMKCFEMCSFCEGQYINPANRRYHAQPVCCFDCGPELYFKLAEEQYCVGDGNSAIQKSAQYIQQGKIVAIKGIGGYHLCCSATSEDAVQRLRTRKHRDNKPFAVMVKDIETVNKYCFVNEEEEKLLTSTAAPIVLLEKRGEYLPYQIAPQNSYLGVMLPYTPVHHLLFDCYELPEALVMTSGNLSSEPIFYKDNEAFEGLNEIADAFLYTDREIFMRTDDSVTRVFRGKPYILRRSRGYVPLPIKLDIGTLLDKPNMSKQINNQSKNESGICDSGSVPEVLACGGELKNAFCVNKGEYFYMSHHIGDLENEDTNHSFRQAVEHFEHMFSITPEAVAYDLHPNYFSSQYGRQRTAKQLGIQHHKAHIASCMAENALSGDVIGIAFDGTGYGEDGAIWGGEFFYGSYNHFKRAGHLEYVPMPGGDGAIKHPWRMALSYIKKADRLDYIRDKEGKYSFNDIKSEDINFILKMLDKNINCQQTSSMGRFFDAAAAIAGIKADITYEGEAAIMLEHYASKFLMQNSENVRYDTDVSSNNNVRINDNVSSNDNVDSYDKNASGSKGSISSYEKNESGTKENISSYEVVIRQQEAGFVVETDSIINAIIDDIIDNKQVGFVAARFHKTIADMVLKGCITIRQTTSLDRVCLSGGVFQNITLLELCIDLLEAYGFSVYVHRDIPTNDGGIALGQAVMAIAALNNRIDIS